MLVFDPQSFESIRAKCDGLHSHKSWVPSLDKFGNPVFTTASEAAYPRALCQAVAKAAVLECARRGLVFKDEAFRPTNHAEIQNLPSNRGHKALPPLVAEYRMITDVCPANCDFKTLAFPSK